MKATRFFLPLAVAAVVLTGCGKTKEESAKSDSVKSESTKSAASNDQATDPGEKGEKPIKLVGYSGDLESVLEQAAASLQDGDVQSFAEKMFPAEDVRWLKEQDGMANLEFQIKVYPELVTQTLSELSVAKLLAKDADTSGDAVELGQKYRFEKVQGTWRFADHSSAVKQAIQKNGKLPGQGGGGFLGLF